METLYELEGTDTSFRYQSDIGKFLSTGDYVLIKQHYFRIRSKTYDVWHNKWIFVIEDTNCVKKED